jgi:organic radical activating enzyme
MLVKGNFDLYITNVCNLHCKNCIVLDYKGRVTIPHLSLEEIKEIIEKIPVQLEQLQLVGGEPSLHPQFVQIVHYLKSVPNLYQRLSIVTNGTNYTPETAKVFELFDVVIHSEYTELGHTPKLPPFVTKKYDQPYFEQYFVPLDPKHTAESNWKNCYMKDECSVLTKEGVYHCPITMNEKVEVTEYSSLKSFRDRTQPLDFCEQCPMPCLRKRWRSNRPTTDRRVYQKGRENLVQLLNLYSSEK